MFKNALTLKKLTVAELCTVAMLVALTAVLSYLSGFLRIGNISKFSVSFISVYVAGALFGPWIGGAVGALADFISFAVNPTGGYVPWFTLIEFVNGFLFGVFFCGGVGDKRNFKIFVVKAVLCSLSQLAVNMIFRTYILVKLGFMPMSFSNAFVLRIVGSGTMAVVKVPVLVALEGFLPTFEKVACKKR